MSVTHTDNDRLNEYVGGEIDERKPNNDRRVNQVQSFLYKLHRVDRRTGIDRRRSILPTL